MGTKEEPDWLCEQSALEALEFPLGTVAIQTASGYEERKFHK